MKKVLFRILIVLLAFYVLVYVLFYSFQERLFFKPEKLSKDYVFNFNQDFEEVNIKTKDNKILNGLLFKSNDPKGLIFYLHGASGSLKNYGAFTPPLFTDSNYDIYIIDYRGYGKSEGKITSQKQIYEDIQIAYNTLLEKYDEENIIVLGFSFGTGIAAKIASTNNPKALILLAPYYSWKDLMMNISPAFHFLPGSIKYSFETYKYLKDCKMPVYIFHGNRDGVVFYESSVRLKSILKSLDKLITLNGHGHDPNRWDSVYINEIRAILNCKESNGRK